MVDVLVYIVILLVILNVISFLAFFRDKGAAKRSTWRTPERRLLLLALLGPFGAYGAMRRFGHKTRKAKFRLVPIFLCLQIALFAVLILAFVGLIS
jgi:uncharacterized membrane protein YsdA (DUF1294 family)